MLPFSGLDFCEAESKDNNVSTTKHCSVPGRGLSLCTSQAILQHSVDDAVGDPPHFNAKQMLIKAAPNHIIYYSINLGSIDFIHTLLPALHTGHIPSFSHAKTQDNRLITDGDV